MSSRESRVKGFALAQVHGTAQDYYDTRDRLIAQGKYKPLKDLPRHWEHFDDPEWIEGAKRMLRARLAANVKLTPTDERVIEHINGLENL